MKIVAVGECTQDRYVDRQIDMVGGISLNFAIQARRSGADRVAIVSCIGTDAGGEAARDKLAREGIDASHLHVRPGPTATQLIRLGAGGERHFPPGGYTPGVLVDFALGPEDLRFIGGFDVVALAFFRQIEHLFRPGVRAAADSAMRVADLLDGADLGAEFEGLAGLLPALDVAFISGDVTVVERLLPASRDAHAVIVVTHGAAGSTALVRGERLFERAAWVPEHERIDSTGCGDAFQAAFTVEYFRSRAVASALRAGARRATEVIRHLGATGA